MAPKIKEFVDTVVEIRATVLAALAVIFEFRGFDDTATVALLTLSVLLYGYIRRVDAGPFQFEGKDNE